MTNSIRKLRQERKLTIANLAQQVGVTEAMLRRWETGRARPRQLHQQILARRLKVTIDDLGLDQVTAGAADDDESARGVRCA